MKLILFCITILICYGYQKVQVISFLVYTGIMPHDTHADIKKFHFRNLHSQIKMGMASDRYAGLQAEMAAV